MLTNDEKRTLKAMLVIDEGYRNKIYKDTNGNETVGVGHLCANGFSNAVVDLICDEDMTTASNFLDKNFVWFDRLDTPRRMAVCNMVFNLGTGKFQNFKNFIAAMSCEAYHVAAAEVLDSDAARELPNRYARIAAIIETGRLPVGG